MSLYFVNICVCFSQRYAELRQAAVMKYGEAVHGMLMCFIHSSST